MIRRNSGDSRAPVIISDDLDDQVTIDSADQLSTDSNEDEAAAITSSRKTPKPLPKGGGIIDTETEERIKKLIFHYESWAYQACLSTYEFSYNKAHIIETNEQLIELTNDQDIKNRLEEANQNLLNTQAPLSEITQFGIHCKSHSTSQGDLEYKKYDNTPPIMPPDDYRNSTIDLESNVTVDITEKFRTEPNKQQLRFISETLLPENLQLDQIQIWARAVITSFLAAAPSGTNKLNFEDGLTPLQLAVAISYCELMGYDYNIGAKQQLRIFATELKTRDTNHQLTEEQWDKLAQNKVVDINPPELCETLVNMIPAGNLATHLETITRNEVALSTDGWQQWVKNHYSQDFDPIEDFENFPTLGKKEREDLLIAINQPTPAPSPLQSNMLLRRPFATLAPGPSAGAGAESEQGSDRDSNSPQSMI